MTAESALGSVTIFALFALAALLRASSSAACFGTSGRNMSSEQLRRDGKNDSVN